MKCKATNQFILVPNEVTFDPLLQAGDIRIYAAIRSHRNEKEKKPVNPAKATLAKRLECCEDTIERGIKRLVQQGHLTYVKGNSARSNRYQFKDDYITEDRRTDAGIIAADTRKDSRSDAEKSPAFVRYQPEPYNHYKEPERKPPFFHGKDRAYIEEGGDVTIKRMSGDRVPWGFGDAGAFCFGNYRGEEALQAARRYYGSRYGTGDNKSGNVSSLPTSEEDSDSSRPNNPALLQSE